MEDYGKSEEQKEEEEKEEEEFEREERENEEDQELMMSSLLNNVKARQMEHRQKVIKLNQKHDDLKEDQPVDVDEHFDSNQFWKVPEPYTIDDLMNEYQ